VGAALDTGTLYQLLTPFVSFAFSAAFFVIFYHSSKKPSIALFGFSYLIGGIALAFDVVRLGFNEVTTAILINSLYLLTLSLMTAAFALHFHKKIPYKTMLAISVITLAAMSWYLLADYNITLRTAVMNFGAGLILVPALAFVPRKDCHVIYKAIFWVLLVSCGQFYLRTGLTMAFADEPLSMANYRDSIYLVAFHFSITLASVALALTLCIAIGMEEISNLQRISETDPLSGLVNRRGFEQMASQQIEQMGEKKVPLSLIVCDIDHFKKVNDNFGHDVGDQIIKEFGKIIKNSCRRTDIVARIGGEEFCILLPVATKEMGLMVANSARETFAAHVFRNLPEGSFQTASFGIAQLEPGEDYESLFKRADEALYEAKQSGRNKSIVSGGIEPKQNATGMGARARRNEA